MVKTPGEVGRDFDEYAEKWEAAAYRMETSWDGSSMGRSDGELRYPGDEWGEIDELVDLYASLFARLIPGEGRLNVLEIGAGGGRSTQALLEVLGARIDEYHVIDVSEVFLDILRGRIDRPVELHVVDRVDLSDLPADTFQLCVAQSSWSHISFHDQYLYLRELRRVLSHGAPLVVSGQFILGLGNDWSWDRFRRRVYQIENEIGGVHHEFTGVGILVETLARLEWDIEIIHGSGFVARRSQANPQAFVRNLEGPLMFPFLETIDDYAEGAVGRRVFLG